MCEHCKQLAEVVFSLVGDLYLSGALSEWKLNHFHEKLRPMLPKDNFDLLPPQEEVSEDTEPSQNATCDKCGYPTNDLLPSPDKGEEWCRDCWVNYQQMFS